MAIHISENSQTLVAPGFVVWFRK